MRYVLIAVVLLTAATGHAQAPGQVAPEAVESVMSHRCAVELSLGTASLEPQVSGASASGLGVGELAARYRVATRVELALAFDAGGAKQDDLSLGGIYFDVRYRFLPEEPWNWFLLGGLGVASASQSNASSLERKGRGSLRAGAGVERRFHQFAIAAQLRLIAIGANNAAPDTTMPTQAYRMARFAVSGGMLTVGASYYF